MSDKGKKSKKASSSQALLRQQLAGLASTSNSRLSAPLKTSDKRGKPIQSHKKNSVPVSAEGVPLTKAEVVRLEEQKRKAAVARQNAAYLQAGQKSREAESAAVAQLLAEQRRLHALKHPNKNTKAKVKIGQRKLGPGFLERYGTGSEAAQ